MTGARTTRSRQSEAAVADRLHVLYPRAVRVPASIPGKDVLNTPGLAIEVKARRRLDLPAWLRQASKNSTADEIPVVVSRPDGFGPATVDDWPVTLRLADFIALIERAGMGET